MFKSKFHAHSLLLSFVYTVLTEQRTVIATCLRTQICNTSVKFDHITSFDASQNIDIQWITELLLLEVASSQVCYTNTLENRTVSCAL